NVTANTVASPAGPEWVLAPTPPTFTNFYGVSWPTAVQLMAVGENTGGTPTILRSLDQGATWITQDLPSSAELSNHGLRDVWFPDHDHGWAVGRSGAIVHTATGGSPWPSGSRARRVPGRRMPIGAATRSGGAAPHHPPPAGRAPRRRAT